MQWTDSGRVAAEREGGRRWPDPLGRDPRPGDRLQCLSLSPETKEVASVRLTRVDAAISSTRRPVSGPLGRTTPSRRRVAPELRPALAADRSGFGQCWRPSAGIAPAAPEPPRNSQAAAVVRVTRRRPRPSDSRACSASAGRAIWTGRLVPIRDTEPVDDEAFVRAWAPAGGAADPVRDQPLQPRARREVAHRPRAASGRDPPERGGPRRRAGS